MQYQPTIDVYEGNTLEMLQTGKLVLQVGQWIKCGSGPCSRWCGVTNTGSLVAAHPGSNKGVTLDSFKSLIAYWKSRKA